MLENIILSRPLRNLHISMRVRFQSVNLSNDVAAIYEI